MAATPIDYFGPSKSQTREPAIRTPLLDDDAKNVAARLAKFETTQLRRFYGFVSQLRNEVRSDASFSDDLIRSRLALLKARVVYAYARDKNKFPEAFVEFINANVSSVQTRDDFLFGFAPYFEAVVAYHRLENARK